MTEWRLLFSQRTTSAIAIKIQSANGLTQYSSNWLSISAKKLESIIVTMSVVKAMYFAYLGHKCDCSRGYESAFEVVIVTVEAMRVLVEDARLTLEVVRFLISRIREIAT